MTALIYNSRIETKIACRPSIDVRKFKPSTKTNIYSEVTTKIDVIPFPVTFDEDGLMDLIMENEAEYCAQVVDSESDYDEIEEESMYD